MLEISCQGDAKKGGKCCDLHCISANLSLSNISSSVFIIGCVGEEENKLVSTLKVYLHMKCHKQKHCNTEETKLTGVNKNKSVCY